MIKIMITVDEKASTWRGGGWGEKKIKLDNEKERENERERKWERMRERENGRE